MKIRINSLKETKTKALLITALTLTTAGLLSLAFLSPAAAAVRTTSTTVSCTTPVVVNQASTCTATVTDTSTGTIITPTGAVSFSQTGVTGSFSGPCTLAGTPAGSCSVTFTASTCGTATVTATYAGDPNHSPSSGTFSITITCTSPPVPPECASGVGIDLSTGTNGFTSPNGADPVGTADTTWTVASAPPGVPTAANSVYSVHPLGWGNAGNKVYATSPYVYPGTGYITGFSGNGGGPMGRINWVSYGPSFSNSSGSFSNEPNLFASSPGTQYNYTLSFNPAAQLPGTFRVYNFTADNSVALTLKDASSNPIQTWKSPSYPSTSASDFLTWNFQAPQTVSITGPGPYTLTATVMTEDKSFTAFAVYAVFCHQKSPTITTTLLPASTVFAGGAVTDSAVLLGATTNAGGKVTYKFFTGSTCAGTPTTVGTPAIVTGGVVPNSAAQTFLATGTFSWNAVYSGDPDNTGATSPCETLTVLPTPKSVFTVKFVCNTISPSAASSIGLETGLYDTDINIHNPSFSASNLTLVEKFVIATPQLVSLGPPPNVQTVSAIPTPYVIREVTLGPDAAVQINCAQILSYLGVTSGTAKGFVMIYTGVAPNPASQATVWAEYSAADQSGFGVRSLQLVQIQPTAYVP